MGTGNPEPDSPTETTLTPNPNTNSNPNPNPNSNSNSNSNAHAHANPTSTSDTNQNTPVDPETESEPDRDSPSHDNHQHHQEQQDHQEQSDQSDHPDQQDHQEQPDQHHRVSKDQISDFSAELSTLKQDGCALLVTGALPLEHHRHAARRMLGENGSTARHCLLAFTHTDPHTVDHSFYNACANHNGDSLILNSSPHPPSIKAQLDTPLPLPQISLPPQEIGELVLAISETITAIEQRHQPGGLGSAELRVWFDSLSPLLAESEERLLAALSLVVERVAGVNGMGILHLNVEPDAEIVRTIESVVDAVVELRIEHDRVEQRWRLHESNLVTGWIPLSDPSAPTDSS